MWQSLIYHRFPPLSSAKRGLNLALDQASGFNTLLGEQP